MKLEVIIAYGSAFVTYGKMTETKSSRKESSGRDAPDEINRGGYFAVSPDSSKIPALVPQEHQIRMRFDERNDSWVYTFHRLQRVADSWTHLWSVMRRSYNY